MKTKNKPNYLLMAMIVAVLSAATWSCNKDNDPSLAELRNDKLEYLQDSLRISDSLRLTNNAGIVNYGLAIVDGSTSSIFQNGRTKDTQSAIDGAVVTISQYGKIMRDTTDASGIVVFNGFFRSAVTVTVQKADFTSVTFISAVHIQDSTRTGTISFVGNMIPIFPTTGASTATISGIATIQSDLTNTTRELAPAGTTLLAAIDASAGSEFSDKFLTTALADEGTFTSACGCKFVMVGNIKQASYQTGVIGTTDAAGAYSVTVPAAIDGLPLRIEYSDVALQRKRFDDDDDANSSNRIINERTIYGPNVSPTSIDPSGGVDVSFDAGAGATASALIAQVGTVESVTVTNGGANFSGTPIVDLVGGGGTGATATATVTNKIVSSVNIVTKGSGYTSAPTVVFRFGTGASASVTTLEGNGTVLSATVLNTGSGYTSAPTVTFTGGGAPTTVATGVANIAAGRVTSITITNVGAGYTSTPTITLGGGGFTTAATAQANFSGLSIGNILLGGSGGSNYTYAPSVTIGAPNIPGGVPATAIALFDIASGSVTGIQVTNAGSGYTAFPSVTVVAGSITVAGTALLTGSGVVGVDITAQGSGYVGNPTVVFSGGGGTGAVGTAQVVAGKVVGITVNQPGSGYTTAPTISLIAGAGATAVATIGASGAVTSIRIVSGGSGYVGSPRVTIEDAVTGPGTGFGDGATGTATVVGGTVTGVTITNQGSGYVSSNIPNGAGESFKTTITTGTTPSFMTKPGIKYINDVYLGTGSAQGN